MKTNRTTITTAIVLAFGLAPLGANAALLATSNLSISPGALVSGSGQPSSGSWFALNLWGPWIYTAIEGKNGINLGTSQLSDAIPSGNIDMPWQGFLGYTGVHQTSSPVTIVSDDHAGNVVLDFGGWNYIQPDIRGSWPAETGYLGSNMLATMSCANNCSNGESFTLDFSSQMPLWFYDTGNIGGMQYQLHIEGVITSAVPIPSAMWLFGSSLLGLVGVARRKAA